MMSLGFFAVWCGVHLAMLQYNYFYLLLLNMTSTYITYAVVVLSWMTGTLIGLWWQRLNPNVAILMGIVSYYAIYALLKNVPLASLYFSLGDARCRHHRLMGRTILCRLSSFVWESRPTLFS